MGGSGVGRIEWPVPQIDPERCDGCGLCLRVCRCGALGRQGDQVVVAWPERCDYSGLCELACPRQAIQRIFEIIVVDRLSEEGDRGTNG